MFVFLRFFLALLITIVSFSAFAASPMQVIDDYIEPDTSNNFFVKFKMKEFPKSDILVKIDCSKPIYFNPDNRRFEIIQKMIQWGCNKKFNVELNGSGVFFYKKEIVKVDRSNEDINYHARVVYCPTNNVDKFGFGNSYRWHKELKPQPSKNPKERVSVDVGVDTRYYYIANWTEYRVCKNIDKNNKSQVSVCKKVKSKAKGYFDDLVELTKMLYNLPINNPSSSYKNIEITASSPETVSATKYFGIDTKKFGWIEFSGRVFTQEGKIPQDAIVKLESISTLVDKNGKYRIKYKVSNKNAIMHIDQDFILDKRINNLSITTIHDKLVANGRYYTVKLRVIGDSKPLANKSIILTFAKEGFFKNNKRVHYLTDAKFSKTIKTNAKGWVVLKIRMPKAKSNTIKSSNIEKLFPVQATLKVKLKGQQASTITSLQIFSPYPEITKVLLPGGMDAQQWQINPSKIFIEDIDSNRFNIKIMGYGRFKTKGGKIYSTLFRQTNFKGKVFEFYFASKQLGLDLNKQPEVWKEFLETNIKTAVSFLLAANEGTSFQRLREIKSKNLTNAIDYDTATGIVKTGFSAEGYYNATLGFIHETKKDYVGSADWVLGGISLTNDVISLIKKTPTTLAANLQMEVMKAIYENAKTTYNIYKKYRKITDSYKDIIFIPISITVSDSDGYSTSTIKSIAVRFWKENN